MASARVTQEGVLEQPKIAVFGLAVMGSNLARNIASRSLPLAVYNRSAQVTEDFMKAHGSELYTPAYSLDELIEKTSSPRQILLMIKAGKPVDLVLKDLLPKLSKGDIVMDGGNAFYRDTQRRAEECEKFGVHFLGVGISGGEEGALHGPSIMPGGSAEAWSEVEPLLTNIAADFEGTPCAHYVGSDGSGHFVKMVHNGIEYADMQLIAEVYHLMKVGLSLSNDEIGEQFAEWNTGRLSSYLMEITAQIFRKEDSEGDGHLIDAILDKAGQKGTGRWTSQESLEFGVPIPTIAAAVDARGLSSLREERLVAENHFMQAGEQSEFREPTLLRELLGETSTGYSILEQALYVGKVVAYAQGLSLIRVASDEFKWNLSLDKVASLWRAGCIIRARLLQDIMSAYQQEPQLKNLVLYPEFTDSLKRALPALRTIVSAGALSGIPLPGLTSALSYLDAYSSARLPQNLIQAQRDFFGAHTYERLDKKGSFHTDWE